MLSLRHLLLRSRPKTLDQTLTLTLTQSFFTHRRRKKKSDRLPSSNKYDLTEAIASLPSRFTPSDVASLISRHRNPHLCYQLFTWATHQPRYRPDPSLFLVTVQKLGNARLIKLELRNVASLAFASLPPTLPLFNTILYFFAKARMIPIALHVYALLRDSPDPAHRPNIFTYNILFKAFLSRSVNSYVSRMYMEPVTRLFRQMMDAGVRPDIRALNFLVRGYVLSLNLNDALRVFLQFGPVHGVEPNVHTYSYLVHGLCVQGRTKNAMELYGEMRRKGMVPSVRTGNSLVSALAIGGEVDEGVRVMWELTRMRMPMEELTVRTAVEEVWREKGKEAALGLARELKEKVVVDRIRWRGLKNWVEDECGYGR